MKNVKATLFGALLMAFAATAAGCDTGGEKESGAITVKDRNSLSQEVFADETAAPLKVEITTESAWTSSIIDRKDEMHSSTASAPNWVSIDPESGGKAGDYSLTVKLTANTTALERSAVITLTCEKKELRITVTQKGTNKDGSLPSIDDIVENSIQLEIDARKAFLTVDAAYPTLASRESLTASAKPLYDFWTKAYETIESCNHIVEIVDLYPDLAESEKNRIRANAQLRRGTLYLWLVTLFGDVPMPVHSGESHINLPRVDASAAKDLLKSDLEYANEFLEGYDRTEAMYMCALQGMQRDYDVAYALEFLTKAIESGELVWDLNVDGQFNKADDGMAVHAHLLAAEASIESGNSADALGYVNRIYTTLGEPPFLTAAATNDEIREGIRTTFSSWNTGMKILNAERWGETSEWGYRGLLPIPQGAMDENPNLLQNPGWDPN